MRRRRSFLVAAAVAVIALAGTLGATGARGAPVGTPTDIATAFTHGFLAGDAGICDLSSVELKAFLARLTHNRDCTTSMAMIRLARAADVDATEKVQLHRAIAAATAAAVERYAVLGGKAWFGKRFPLAALARAIRAEAPTIQVRLGAGPAAARRSAADIVVVDTTRSTPTRLVLYGESGTGAIWQLSAAPSGKSAFARLAVRGVAAAVPRPPVRAFALAPAAPTDTTLVVTSVKAMGDTQPTELLLPVSADGLVQSARVGRAVVPPPAGGGAGAAATFAAALTDAYRSTARDELCNLLHPALVDMLLRSDSCSVAGKPTAALDVTSPADRLVTADGSTVVAIRLGNAPDQLTAFNLVVPTAAGYRVTGLFVDLAELIELGAHPI